MTAAPPATGWPWRSGCSRIPRSTCCWVEASSWRQLPEITASLAAGTAGELCHTIDWSTAGEALSDERESK